MRKRDGRISAMGSQITAMISVTLVLLIIGLLAMTMIVSRSAQRQIRSNAGFVVKIDRDATDGDIARVGALLGLSNKSGQSEISEVVFRSAEEIMAEESALMGEQIDSLLGDNPFGPEYEVRVTPDYAVTDSIERIAARLRGDAAVNEVVTQGAVVDRINAMMRQLSYVLGGMALALMIISFVLINNTVSLSVYSRRFIIHTMKLVGATGGFIRRPFVRAAVWIGIVSAVIANGILFGAWWYGCTLTAEVEELLPCAAMWCVMGVVLLASLLICMGASAMATNRYLRASYDEMFKN